MLRTPLKAVLDGNEAVLETDFRNEVAAARTPTLIIHGDPDASAPMRTRGGARRRRSPDASSRSTRTGHTA